MFNFLKNKKIKMEGDGVFVLFDIGGTKTRVAASRDGKTIGDIKTAETPKDFGKAINLIKKMKDEVSLGEHVKAVALGVPGILSRDRRRIFRLPNLSGWDGKDFSTELEKIINAPVYIENDATLVGLGEAVNGAGRGYGIVAYITVSTGVGGVRIVGGSIDRKTFGFEPGWQIINFADLIKNENNGYLGSYISGRAIEEKFGKYPIDVSDTKILDELALELAVGLYNVILLWSPDAVILGGSMITGVNPIPLDKVEEKLRELLTTIFPEIPVIKKAILGDKGGLYGALEFVSKKYGN